MTTQATVSTPSRTCTPAQRVTRSLLGYGVLAGTVFEASILIQGLTRHGFRLAHHDATDRAEDAREEFGRAAALTGNDRERALFRARADACLAAAPGSD